jgi:Arabinofuranosyltransferase A C terminal
MIILTPWILSTFLRLPRERGGLHWLPAGLIGGLIVLTYSGYLVFAVLGIIAIVLLVWRASNPRMPYVRHVLGVIVTAFVVASWYVVPFLKASLTDGGQRISDLYRAPVIVSDPLPLRFLDLSPLGIVEIIGLVGLVWYRRREWWAQPMLLLVASTVVYRMFFMVVTAMNGHTGYLEYTDRLTYTLLLAAGVLTIARAAPEVASRVTAPLATLREVAAVAVLVTVGWTAVETWTLLSPAPVADIPVAVRPHSAFATQAHITALPNGGFPRFAPASRVRNKTGLPVYAIRRRVEATLGSGARPNTLSFDDGLFAFLPYYSYLPRVRIAANTLTRWDDRYATLDRLSRITDPAEFAAASASLPFGRIDVFVLQQGTSRWYWTGGYGLVGEQRQRRVVSFRAAVFRRSYFKIYQLPDDVVLAVRLPQ